ncbi:TolB family protein [Gemmatimonadota bacterium]
MVRLFFYGGMMRLIVITKSFVLLIGALCISSCGSLLDPDGGMQGDPQTGFLFQDKYPVRRPQHSQIAFARYLGSASPDSASFGLHLIDIETNSLQILHEGIVGRPTWLDSNTVFYSGSGGQLCSLNLESNQLTIHTDYAVSNPTINQMDSTVVFEDGPYLWILDLHTNEKTLISSGGHSFASWSPTDMLFAISERNSTVSFTISLMTPSGHITKRLTAPENSKQDSYPNWDNWGLYIVYSSEEINDSNKAMHNIYKYDINTATNTKITGGYGPSFYSGTTEILYYAASSRSAGDYRIYLIDTNTGSKQQITH